MVGIQSGLLMFPINILIITIFRSIKPRIVSKKDKDEEMMKPPPVSIPTILKVNTELTLRFIRGFAFRCYLDLISAFLHFCSIMHMHKA